MLLVSSMQDDIEALKVRAIIPTMTGCAIFLAATNKSFVIYVDPNLGETIANILQEKSMNVLLLIILLVISLPGLKLTFNKLSSMT